MVQQQAMDENASATNPSQEYEVYRIIEHPEPRWHGLASDHHQAVLSGLGLNEIISDSGDFELRVPSMPASPQPEDAQCCLAEQSAIAAAEK